MATMITEGASTAVLASPSARNEAISEGEDIYVIDPNLCTECVGFTTTKPARRSARSSAASPIPTVVSRKKCCSTEP